MQSIDIARLVYILIPALLVVGIQWLWAQKPGTTLYAIARMCLQLVLIGYALTYIFAGQHLGTILLILTLMLVVSAWIALGPVRSIRRSLFVPALLSTAAVNTVLLAIIVLLILQSDPWYAPNTIIPIAGMVFATGMNSMSLFAERFFAELQHCKDSVAARNIAYQATLIPTINSLFAVGLVSLPGMMTGQILSGVSPLIAVRYQIMIMLMLLASSGLTAAAFALLLNHADSVADEPE